MILTLPLEIILNISRNLNFDDKLNLKTTCHKLNGFLTKAVLYEELNFLNLRDILYSDQSHFKICNGVLQKLINEQFDGSFVKILHLDLRLVDEPILPLLPDLFPNVTRLVMSTRDKDKYVGDDAFLPNDSRVKHLLSKWKDKIEKIDSRFDWEEPIKQLLNYRYSRLTDLDITHFNRYRRSWSGEPCKVLPINTPLLTRLTVRDTGFSLEMLEEIHTDFPQLTSLRLINCKKYTSLQQLVYSVEPEADYTRATSDQLDAFPWMSEQEFEEFVSTQMASFSTNSALETKLFSNLPTSMKSLTLHINNIENAIATLAETNLKLQTLDLLDYKRFSRKLWKDPSMLKHFKQLTSLKALKIPLYSSLQTFTPDYISLSVTKLVVDVGGDVFYIDWILSTFSSIEELFINPITHPFKHYAVLSKSNNKKETQMKTLYPKLRHLNIRESKVYPDALEFIKTAAPNLEELDLVWPIPRSARKVMRQIDLSNWHLNKCYLEFTSPQSVVFIHCTVTIQNISKHFVVENSTKLLVPTHRTYNKGSIGEYVEVILSDDINHVRLFGFNIVKVGDKILIDY